MVEDTTPEESDDPEIAAGRIEAALERIARHIRQPAEDLPREELAARLDRVIERLRLVLGRPAP